MSELPILYRVAEDGPFDLQVDNGVVIENITDDLVNAKILIPDHRLQAIADAWDREFTQCRQYASGDGMCVQCVEYLGELLGMSADG